LLLVVVLAALAGEAVAVLADFLKNLDFQSLLADQYQL
jgi:hypothetical protein